MNNWRRCWCVITAFTLLRNSSSAKLRRLIWSPASIIISIRPKLCQCFEAYSARPAILAGASSREMSCGSSISATNREPIDLTIRKSGYRECQLPPVLYGIHRDHGLRSGLRSQATTSLREISSSSTFVSQPFKLAGNSAFWLAYRCFRHVVLI